MASLAACTDDDRTGPAADAGQDSGTDTGTDADSDSDADGGTDTDTDTDTGPGDKATWISAGGSHTCAVIEGGYVKCWGYGQFGALGYGLTLTDDTDADTSLPSTLPFVPVGAAVKEIDAGGYHTCALLENGDAKCWGYNASGQLGVETGPYETIGEYDEPSSYAPIDFGGAKVTQLVAAEGNFTIALLEGGEVDCVGACWGGEGEMALGGPATQVCAGSNHVCTVLGSGEVYCWGLGQYGALGYGDTDDVSDPMG